MLFLLFLRPPSPHPTISPSIPTRLQVSGRRRRSERGNIHNRLLILHTEIGSAATTTVRSRARKLVVELLQSPLAEAVERVVFALKLGEKLVFVVVVGAFLVEDFCYRRVEDWSRHFDD